MSSLRSDFRAVEYPTREEPRLPLPVEGAEWQAGVTPDNDSRRIMLNGQPVVYAFAASESQGWVMVYGEPQEVRIAGKRTTNYRVPNDHLGINPATGDRTEFKTLHGYVQIVGGDAPVKHKLCTGSPRTNASATSNRG